MTEEFNFSVSIATFNFRVLCDWLIMRINFLVLNLLFSYTLYINKNANVYLKDRVLYSILGFKNPFSLDSLPQNIIYCTTFDIIHHDQKVNTGCVFVIHLAEKILDKIGIGKLIEYNLNYVNLPLGGAFHLKNIKIYFFQIFIKLRYILSYTLELFRWWRISFIYFSPQIRAVALIISTIETVILILI